MLRHPILFFFNTQKNILIKGPCDIRCINKIEFGKNIVIGNNARINFYDETNDKMLYIGDNTYIVNRVSFLVGGKIKIGQDCLIASDVSFISENHSIQLGQNIPYKDQPLEYGDIYVGNNVWIGEKVIVLPQVVIGNNSIVGAGSIVTKSIPEDCLVVGNLAQIIKKYNHINNKWETIR